MATSSPFPNNTSSSNNACQVRVGVRIRPLTSQEAGEGGRSSVLAGHQQHAGQQQQEIRLGQRRFTYDAVFDADVSQHDLYRSVSAPLLTTFLDGYNATVREPTVNLLYVECNRFFFRLNSHALLLTSFSFKLL
jgi:hypothetical protein